MEHLISKLATFVVDACKSENNIYGYGIWSHHIKPMIPLGQKLADEYNANKEIVTISILLHDLAGIENADNTKEHHIIGAERAEELLLNYNYPREKIDTVKKCILNHRSSVNNCKNSVEEVCVADADGIIHLLEIGSLFFAAYKEMGKSIDEGQKWIKEKLEKDFKKLSEKSKEKYGNNFKKMIAALDEECKTST